MTTPTTKAISAAPIFLVLNLRSGSVDTDTTEQIIADVLRQAGREFEFIQCEGIGVAAAAKRAAALATARDGVIVAIGGDGTINAVARAASAAKRPLGIVPCGTFNYFARAMGIPQDAEAAARALLSGRTRPAHFGCANGELFLVNASLGLYPQLLEDREAFSRQVGRHRITAIVSSLLTVLRSGRQLNLDAGGNGGVRTPTVFIGNNRVQLERLGIDPALLDRLDQGQLVGLALRPISTLQLLGLLLRGALGRLGEAEHINRFAFRTLKVSPRGRRRVKVALDGEVVKMRTPIRFESGPEPLQVLVPVPEDEAEIK